MILLVEEVVHRFQQQIEIFVDSKIHFFEAEKRIISVFCRAFCYNLGDLSLPEKDKWSLNWNHLQKQAWPKSTSGVEKDKPKKTSSQAWKSWLHCHFLVTFDVGVRSNNVNPTPHKQKQLIINPFEYESAMIFFIARIHNKKDLALLNFYMIAGQIRI